MKFMIALTLFCASWVAASSAAVDRMLEEERVTGGELAGEGQFPYMVSMARSGKHTCGGTIIHKRWILTAAHCIKTHSPTEMTIVAGTIRRSEGGITYKVDRAIMHDPVWDADNFGNDIGLLRVTEDIEFNDRVQPATLHAGAPPVEVGGQVTLSGWGRVEESGHSVDDLHWIQLTVISKDACQAGHKHIVRDYMMCTFTRVGEGSCKGDSGSPIVMYGQVVGISSWGKHCGGGYPNVYTRVASFYSWVNQTIAENSV